MTTTTLDDGKTVTTLLAALLVVFGTVVGNTAKAYFPKNWTMASYLGTAMFLGGWVYTAWLLGDQRTDEDMYVIYSSAAVIALSSAYMKYMMDNGKKYHFSFPVLYSVAWLVFGFYISKHMDDEKQYLGLLSSLLVIVAMVFVLPYQRRKKVVDGPALVLYTLAWANVVFINSSR